MILPLTVSVRLHEGEPARLIVVYVPHHQHETVKTVARRAAITAQIVAHVHHNAAREIP